jgi:hypothetical protein
MPPGNHFADARLGETFRAGWVGLLQPLQSLLERSDFLLRLLLLREIGDHGVFRAGAVG